MYPEALLSAPGVSDGLCKIFPLLANFECPITIVVLIFPFIYRASFTTKLRAKLEGIPHPPFPNTNC